MTNRRTFLQGAASLVQGAAAFAKGAAGLSAASLAGKTAFANGFSVTENTLVIIDTRHDSARQFGTSAGLLGATVSPIAGDITNLWRDQLLPEWRSGKIPVLVGLTERPALFLLERLAWEHRLRVIFEAEHDPYAPQGPVHDIIRHSDPGLKNDLLSAGNDWPVQLAGALLVERQREVQPLLPTDAGLAAHHGEQTKLYSWVIEARRPA